MPFITKLGSVAARAYGWLATTVSVAVNDAYFYLVSLLLSTTSTNGAQNNTFLDSSPNNFTITRNGNTTQGSFSPFSQTGWSNYFDGTGDYLTVPDNAAFTLGASDFTVEFWFYQLENSISYIVSQNSGTSATSAFDINVNSLTVYGVIYYGSSFIALNGGAISLNRWNHIALCRSGATLSIYVNGTLTATNSSAGVTINDSSAPISISGISSGLYPLKGSVSNVRIVKGTAVYTSNFTPPTAPLTPIANTSLLTCNSQSIVDTGPYNFTITRNGDARVTANGPFAPSVSTPTSYSGWFDGTGDYLNAGSNSAFAFGTGAYTVEFWIYPLSLSSLHMYVRNDSTGGWQLYYDTTTGISVGSVGAGAFLTAGAVNVGAWVHVAVVRSSTSSNQTKIYKDGVLSATGTDSTNWTVTGPMSIAATSSGTFAYNGYISNLRVVKGTAVYTSNFTPPTAPLTAITNTSLLTCQNATFIDNSTNAFALTVNGNAQPRTLNPFGYTTTQPVAWSATTNGGSGYFDGTGDYLSIADNAALDMGSSNFTMECWFYPLVTPNGNLFAKRSSSAVYGGAMVIFSSTLTPTIYATTTGSTWEVIKTSTVGCVLNSWNHIAFTRSSTTWTIFVNGVSGGSVTVSGTIPDNTAAFTVGAGAADGTSPISQSYISNAQVIKGTALYTSAFAPPPAPLTPVAGTSLLLNCTNAGIYDAASQNDLETVGNAQVSTAQSKWGGGSMYFDGTGDYLVPSNNLSLTFGTGSFTIEAWVYAISFAGFPTIIDYRPTSTNGAYPLLYLDVSGAPVYYVNSTAVITGSALSANTWYHIALCRSGTSTRLFINGAQVGSTISDSNSYLGPASRPIIGGNGYTLGTGIFNGYIDDLRITKYARYTSNFTPPSAAFPTQ